MLSLSRIPFVTTILALLLAPPRSGFAASVQTSNCDALLLKGEQLLAEAKPQEGRKVILDATRACPKNSKGYALLGLAYDLESRFGEAQEAYRQAILLDPGIAGFHNNLAVSYFRSGNAAEAIKEFHKALQLDPRNQLAHTNLAAHYLEKHDYVRAVNHFQAAGAAQASNPALLFAVTQAFFGAGQKKAALESASRLSRLAASDARIHFSLGLLLAQNGEYEAASAEFRAIPLPERDFAAYQNLGMACSKLKKFAEARQAYEQALRLEPSNPEPYLRIGLAWSAQGNPEEAIAWIQKARERAPGSVEITYALAEELIHSRAYDRAQDLLTEALQKWPSEPALLEAQGDFYFQQRQGQKALQTYLESARRDPRRASARLALARVYAELRQTQEAKSELDRVLELEPQNPQAKVILGRLALDAGQQDQASRLLEQALATDPDHLEANEDLAKIKLRENKLDEAHAVLVKLVKLDPTNSRFHYQLSRVLFKLQRPEEAQRELDLSRKYEATDNEGPMTVPPARSEL